MVYLLGGLLGRELLSGSLATGGLASGLKNDDNMTVSDNVGTMTTSRLLLTCLVRAMSSSF